MSKKIMIVSACLSCLFVALLLPAASARGRWDAQVVVLDNWPADSALEPGEITCPGGELIWDGPIPSCTGDRLHQRGALAYACVTASRADGTAEPLLTGVAFFTLNATLDSDYTGSVWGEWTIVPAQTCDPAVRDDATSRWEGSWQGQRTLACDGRSCVWIGVLHGVLRGSGGELDGMHLTGVETTTTFTPLPAPYELIPGLCQAGGPCPPEGTLTGEMWMAGGPHWRRGGRR